MLRTLVFLLFCCLNANAQNLVMNPSFEEHYSCDFGASNIWECKGVFNPVVNPSTPDYFNACMPEFTSAQVPYPWGGYQQAKDGEAYIGIYVSDNNFQEYVQIKLSQTLDAEVEYDFSFSVNLSNLSRYSSDDIHVKFVADSAVYNQMLHEVFLPDWKNEEGNFIVDTTGWINLSGKFQASGNENWMIIGCFYGAGVASSQISYPENSGSASAYYFIDAVNLTESRLEIPNIFTPNNDGVNDLWTVDADVNEVTIYDRWGSKVYASINSFSGWDGYHKSGFPCSAGVYFYVMTISNANGTTERHKGFLTLLR